MEKEGLQRAVDNLKRDGFTIDLIVTDRHVQIQKWIQETLPDTKHCFDVWHVAKGMFQACSHLRLWLYNFVSDPVGNPEDRFSCNVAHSIDML